MRVTIIIILLIISVKIQKMDKDVIKSVVYLKFDEMKKGVRHVLIFTPFFLITSILEYPNFRLSYGTEQVHFVQDVFLLIFNTVIFVFLIRLNKILILRE